MYLDSEGVIVWYRAQGFKIDPTDSKYAFKRWYHTLFLLQGFLQSFGKVELDFRIATLSLMPNCCSSNIILLILYKIMTKMPLIKWKEK